MALDVYDRSPLLQARLAGLFYLITVITAIFAEVLVRGRLVVRTDAAATAHNILASESLYRLGFVADILNFAAYIVVTLLLYGLLKPVNRWLALLAVFFSLVANAIGSLVALGHLAPLLILKGGHYLAAFNTAQLQAMALLSLRLHAQGYLLALVFFGFYCVLLGYLIFRSTFFPAFLGILVALSGLALLTNSFTFFLSPGAASVVAPFMDALDGIGEISLALWLLLVGVNLSKWPSAAKSA
jgi:Domain of unknown function (DUF4386)